MAGGPPPPLQGTQQAPKQGGPLRALQLQPCLAGWLALRRQCQSLILSCQEQTRHPCSIIKHYNNTRRGEGEGSRPQLEGRPSSGAQGGAQTPGHQIWHPLGQGTTAGVGGAWMALGLFTDNREDSGSCAHNGEPGGRTWPGGDHRKPTLHPAARPLTKHELPEDRACSRLVPTRAADPAQESCSPNHRGHGPHVG